MDRNSYVAKVHITADIRSFRYMPVNCYNVIYLNFVFDQPQTLLARLE